MRALPVGAQKPLQYYGGRCDRGPVWLEIATDLFGGARNSQRWLKGEDYEKGAETETIPSLATSRMKDITPLAEDGSGIDVLCRYRRGGPGIF